MVVMIIYHIMTAYFTFMLVWNLVKTKKVQQAILYAVVLMPFVLRVLHLK